MKYAHNPTNAKGRFMSAVARWCFRHRFVVIAAWVVVLAGLTALGQAVKSNYDNSFSLPGTGSAMAQQLLARAAPAQAGDSDTIVWQVSTGTVRDRTVVARMTGARSRADQPGQPHRLCHGWLHQAGRQPRQRRYHTGDQRSRGGPRARAERPA